jgi:hypothetical protein
MLRSEVGTANDNRLAGGAASRFAIVTLVFVVAGCARLLPGHGPSGEPAVAVEGEAPAECGFPEGTVLSYAGRSTTAELDVQEVVGDVMSDDPADIYITRDKFDQGDKHGRLVCAIFVNDPGFVEITVHPEDGGRFEPVEPTPRPTPPPNGIAEDEAVELATPEVPEDEGWEFLQAYAAPLAEMPVTPDSAPWLRDLPPDLWVWNVWFVRDDMVLEVYVDYVDGSVLGTVQSIF